MGKGATGRCLKISPEHFILLKAKDGLLSDALPQCLAKHTWERKIKELNPSLKSYLWVGHWEGQAPQIT